jgi:AcrR family transcriptional regulator
MARKTYHHGSLREALLEVGEALIEEKGVEAFTLRECARRAGVSHGAPAHHFGDATGFLSELATMGFEELDALMTRYRREDGPEPYTQFIATGRAYVDYALHHPARFQLMFRGEKLRLESERLREAADRTFGQLMDTLSLLPPAGDGDGTALDIGEQAGLAWAIVHGVASLTLDNRGFVECVGGAERVPAALARMLVAARGAFGNVFG